MKTTSRRLELVTDTGRELVVEMRVTGQAASEAAVLRVLDPNRSGSLNMLRVSVLRETAERLEYMGFEDNDPLSLGRGNIPEVLAWVDEMNTNRKGEETS